MRQAREQYLSIDTYIVTYWSIWFSLNIVIFIEIVTNDPIVNRNTWVLVFTLFLGGIFGFCLYMLFNPNVFDRYHTSVIKVHMSYVLSLLLFFIPILYGSALSYNTVSDTRFAEYLNVFFVCSFPSGSIFLAYILKYD